MKRFLSTVLAFLLTVSCLSLPAWADAMIDDLCSNGKGGLLADQANEHVHVQGEAIISIIQEATENEDGIYEKTIYCIECGECLSSERVSYGICTESGLKYNIRDNGINIIEYIGASEDIVIPQYIDGLQVLSVERISNIYRQDSCYFVESVTLPDGLKRIESFAFNNCGNLKYINFPDTLTYIGEYAFSGCPLTGEVLSIPPNITGIEEYTFNGARCSSVIVPSSVRYIRSHAFECNTEMKRIEFQSSDLRIDAHSFDMCNKLVDCYFNGTEDEWNSLNISRETNYALAVAHIIFTDGEKESERFTWSLVDGVLTLNGIGESEEYFWYGDDNGTSAPWSDLRDEIVEVVVGEGITSISGPAFAFCPNLTNVTLPSTLRRIGNTVFDTCQNLESITIPEGVTSIGSCVFWFCSGLKTVYLPKTLELFDGDHTFGYSEIEDIYYSGTYSQWQMIENTVFADISETTTLHFGETDPIHDDFVYCLKEDGCIVTAYVGTSDTITIPDEINDVPVKEVNMGMLSPDGTINTNNMRIREINLPISVERIGQGSFQNWTNLREINGLDSVKYVGDFCFSGSGVEILNFTENLSWAGLYAFDANELISITIPDTLRWKGLCEGTMYDSETVFWNHENLEEINLIQTGNTPTLAKDGPALYTHDLATLICYPCKDYHIGYKIPRIVQNSFQMAFDIRSLYNTDSLYEIYVPSTMSGFYDGIFNRDFFVENLEGELVRAVLPRLIIEEESGLQNWIPEQTQYEFFYRMADSPMLEDLIANIINCTINEDMDDWDKALALNDFLVNNVEYDDTLTHFGAEDALINHIGVCQSYVLAYSMLLNACCIDNDIIILDEIQHSINRVAINGEWRYVDVTWNDSSGNNSYFCMDRDSVLNTYGINFEEDQRQPSVGHRIKFIHENPATFENDGIAEHYACTRCGKLFKDEKGTIKTTEEELSITLYGIYDDYDEIETFEDGVKLNAKSVSLSGNIGVNLKMTVPEQYVDSSYMTFTVHGRTTTIQTNTLEPNSKGQYVFTAYVTSIEMAETINAVFTYGDYTATMTYSVADYIQAYEEVSGNYAQEITDLVHALADYGHHAQTFLSKYRTWTIGKQYAEMNGYNDTYTSEELAAAQANVANYALNYTTNANVEKVNISLNLESETSIYVYLTPTSGYTGKVTCAEGYTVEKIGARYRVTIPNIMAHQLGNTYTLHLTTTAGTVEVNVSALSYANSIFNSDTMNEVDRYFAVALYNYYQSAVAYLN